MILFYAFNLFNTTVIAELYSGGFLPTVYECCSLLNPKVPHFNLQITERMKKEQYNSSADSFKSI